MASERILFDKGFSSGILMAYMVLLIDLWNISSYYFLGDYYEHL